MIGNILVDTGNNVRGIYATSLSSPYESVPRAYDDNDSDDTYERISRFSTAYDNCQFKKNATKYVTSDMTRFPSADIYGNLTNPTSAYKTVTLTNKTYPNLIAAAFNAGDYAARRMRAGEINSIVPLIDTIALKTVGTLPEDTYMKRLANTTDSGIYDKTKPTGLYVYASTKSDLQGAFMQIASQILHLSL
jgi:hypothetical protein